MVESTTFPENLYESIIVLIYGTLMMAAEWLPLMAVLGTVRWLLAKLLDFERQQRIHSLLSGFTAPALMLFLVLFFELLEEFTRIWIPAWAGQLLALGFDVWTSRKRLLHSAQKNRWIYLLSSVTALLATVAWGTVLGINP